MGVFNYYCKCSGSTTITITSDKYPEKAITIIIEVVEESATKDFLITYNTNSDADVSQTMIDKNNNTIVLFGQKSLAIYVKIDDKIVGTKDLTFEWREYAENKDAYSLEINQDNFLIVNQKKKVRKNSTLIIRSKSNPKLNRFVKVSTSEDFSMRFDIEPNVSNNGGVYFESKTSNDQNITGKLKILFFLPDGQNYKDITFTSQSIVGKPCNFNLVDDLLDLTINEKCSLGLKYNGLIRLSAKIN